MTIALGGSLLAVEPVLINRLPEVKRLQQILKFLISVVLVVCCLSFMSVIYSLSQKYRTNMYELVIILVWILYFAVSMFLTDQCHDRGLFVVAWLGIINIGITCIIIVLETVEFVVVTSEMSQDIAQVPVSIVPIYTCLSSVILHIIVVILAFQLSTVIEQNMKFMDHQQI